MRKPLQKQITEAWKKTIEVDYCNQRINSERSLQASLWSQLNSVLPPKTRRLFVEPTLTIRGKRYLPDLVICNTKQVIAVIEIKYEPRKLPSYRKDLETLRAIAANRHKLSLANTRFRGPEADEPTYSFSDKVLFVWGGVHRAFGCRDEMRLEVGKELDRCFLQLHAETLSEKSPEIISRFT